MFFGQDTDHLNRDEFDSLNGAPRMLRLKEGCFVRFIGKGDEHVEGETGKISSIHENLIRVERDSGGYIDVTRMIFEHPGGSRSQFPVVLDYSRYRDHLLL